MKIINYNDVSFVLGENSKENWEILDNYSIINNNYIWFHLNSFPSGYVIMLSDNIVNQDLLNYGALLCKENTKLESYAIHKNKGYGTKIHMNALKQYGPIYGHRLSFKPSQT